MAEMLQRFKASMVLSGVGDALGYRNGKWEFCKSGMKIAKEVQAMGGVENIHVTEKEFMVSDDTVMHLATGEGILDASQKDMHNKLLTIAKHYKKCMNDMDGRAPGITCVGCVSRLKPSGGSYQLPFNPRWELPSNCNVSSRTFSGGGCGAAMRAMCIGLAYPKMEDMDNLITMAVETGRMSHHHPTGYLGSLAAALFVHFAIRDFPIQSWGYHLITALIAAKKYVEKSNHFVEENMNAWNHFEGHWRTYLKLRGIEDGKKEAVFPDKYGVEERDQFYSEISYSGWGGSSGHDATIIAYDALLGAKGNWVELCNRAMFHGGDSDSTGVIAAACYGAMFGFKGVPEINYENLEYKQRLLKLGECLYKLSNASTM